MLSSLHFVFSAFMKNLLSFLFPQSKAFREIVNKCEVLMAMCSILNSCECLSVLTEPFPNKLQLHDCLLVKCMRDFKQHVKEKLHPQLKNYFSLHQKQTFTSGNFGESLYLASCC